MAFQPVDKCVELTGQWSVKGQTVENKFYVQATAAISEAMVTELAHILAVWASGTWHTAMSSDVIFIRAIARDLTSEGSFEVVDNTGTGTAGTGAALAQDNASAFAMHRNTAFSGKKQKSRIYVPPLPSSALSDSNHVASATATALQGALGTLFSNIIAGIEGAYTNGYVSRVLDHAPRAAGLFVPSIGWTFTDLILDSQRRRLPGRGI